MSFYEKNYEQAFKRHCDVEDIGLWNRYKIQMRKAYAVNCAKVLSRTDNISEIVKSILHNNLRFISPPKDGNDKIVSGGHYIDLGRYLLKILKIEFNY